MHEATRNQSLGALVAKKFASSWCDPSRPTVFDKDFMRRLPHVACTFELSRMEQPHYSLCWHDMLPPLHHALAAVGTELGLPHLATGSALAFGVASPGLTPPILHRALPHAYIYGFDSFEGLPGEDHAASRMWNWRKGNLRAPAHVTPEHIVARSGGPNTATIVRGFYNETLTADVAARLQLGRALYVDIDCDLHTSTVSVLDWLLANRIVRLGSLIGYDDFWTIPCNNYRASGRKKILSPLEVGEGLAHAEMAMRHGVRFTCVAGPCRMPPTVSSCHAHNNWAPVFMVDAVREGEGDPGFEFSMAEVAQWMATNKVCTKLHDM